MTFKITHTKQREEMVFIFCNDAEVEAEMSVTLLECALYVVVLRRNKRVAINFTTILSTAGKAR